MAAPDDPEEAARRDAAMQRVRVGITGLAAVFLLTLLAASLLSLFGQDRGGVGRGAPGNASEAPREPLAELGVAPGVTPKPETSAKTVVPPPGAAQQR